ncbi:MAG: DNA-binding protein WhiA [Acutalibacteraceae bacterium]
MSFASDVKKELCACENTGADSLKAEVYGFLLFAKKFTDKEIILSTENPYVANRFTYLLAEVWQVITEKKTALTGKREGVHLVTVSVPIKEECKRIYEDLGHSNTDLSLRINRANIDEENLTEHFLRGVFLCCGTVTNPQKEYHLEFAVPYKNLCADLCRVISEIHVMSKDLRTLMRKGSYTAYMKDSEQISDFLALIGAPIASMEIMQAKILKDIRNNANRKTNSEIANINKTAKAAAVQLNAIEKIKKERGLEFLPEELKEVAVIRLENPELSLRDIGAMLKTPISRSGVNHRIKRIMEIAENL